MGSATAAKTGRQPQFFLRTVGRPLSNSLRATDYALTTPPHPQPALPRKRSDRPSLHRHVLGSGSPHACRTRDEQRGSLWAGSAYWLEGFRKFRCGCSACPTDESSGQPPQASGELIRAEYLVAWRPVLCRTVLEHTGLDRVQGGISVRRPGCLVPREHVTGAAYPSFQARSVPTPLNERAQW
jgi:hypothetical protein